MAFFYTWVMSLNREVEIKFRVDNSQNLTDGLKATGFQLLTPRTHEMNTLYDQPGAELRRRGALLRLREYGSKWILTYKDKSVPQTGPHKSRREIETVVQNGPAMEEMLEALGYKPSFRYEKFRSEWGDGQGHVVIDETPIGNFGEIEGSPEWIDATAGRLRLSTDHYIKSSYAELFLEWKQKAGSDAADMTFRAVS